MRKIIPFQSNHRLGHIMGHISFLRPDDVNNQLIVRDYMPKTLKVLSYMALNKQTDVSFREGSQWLTITAYF